MIDIISRQNPKYKKWQSLLASKGIKKEQQAIVSGEKLIREFLKQNPSEAREILLPQNSKPFANAPAHAKSYRLTKPLFDELDVIGTHQPLLVVQVPETAKWAPAKPKGLELVCALSDPGNMGAVLRSAEALGVQRVVLAQESCSPFLPKAIRASSGACFRVPLVNTGPLKEFPGQPSFALDMEGEDLAKFTWPKDLFLVLGEEGQGVPAELKTNKLKIAMAGQTESLNAVVAASLALFSYRTSLKA